jgi:hypothetical protein
MAWFEPTIKLDTKPDVQRIELQSIDAGGEVHIWTDGKVNLFDLIAQMAQQTGPANLWLCTWSISTPAMKKLIGLKEMGLLKECKAVVDFRTRKDHEEAYQMALLFFDALAIHPNHAKVAVLQGREKTLSAIGSANMTLNPKNERITIFNHKEVAEMDMAAIDEMLQNAERE